MERVTDVRPGAEGSDEEDESSPRTLGLTGDGVVQATDINAIAAILRIECLRDIVTSIRPSARLRRTA
jgi:hypothetical protein